MLVSLAILILAAFVGYFSFVTTFANVFAVRSPALALTIWPRSSEAAARRSAQLLEGGNPRQTRIASQLSVAALNKEPANAAAIRDAGLIAALNGQAKKAEALFAFGETQSRRDFPTQMWLIESRVQKGDIVGALAHYDRAMLTQQASRATLIPVLVQASANVEVNSPLGKILARRPLWWGDFADALIAKGNDAAGTASLMQALKLREQKPDEQARLTAALRHIVDLGGVGSALALYRSVRPSADPNATIRDGGFEHPNTLPPFDWQFSDADDRAPVREPRDGADGNYALSFRGTGAGEAARQLLTLSPGGYDLTAKVGLIPADTVARPGMAIVCSMHLEQVLAQAPLPADSAKLAVAFQVPSGCPSQWLFLNNGASIDAVSDPAWIDDIRIKRKP